MHVGTCLHLSRVKARRKQVNTACVSIQELVTFQPNCTKTNSANSAGIDTEVTVLEKINDKKIIDGIF